MGIATSLAATRPGEAAWADESETISIRVRLQSYCPILAYHSVSDSRCDGLSISTEDLERQLCFLRDRGYHSIRLEDLQRRLHGESFLQGKTVVLTFDDGYADNRRFALPLLEKYGFKATFFVVTAAIGSREPLEFDRAKPARGLGQAAAFEPMTWDDIRRLLRAGMDIGSHTATHCEMGGPLTEEVTRRELCDSKRILEAELDREISIFCYPRGKLSAAAMAAVRAAGYRAAVFTPPLAGPRVPETDYTLKRVGIYRSSWWRTRFKMTPQFFWLREHGWLGPSRESK